MSANTLIPQAELGSLSQPEQTGPALACLPGSRRYTAQAPGDGLEYHFSPGMLADFSYLTADFMLEGDQLAVLVIQLQEGAAGPVFGFSFGLLAGCQARLRLPLASVDQNRWMFPREGALLKPLVWGDRVDLARVDRARLVLHRVGTQPVTWCMTPLTALEAPPDLLSEPALLDGPLLDELGQSRQRQWPGKTSGPAELLERLNLQLAEAGQKGWPQGFSRWGGWLERTYPATGFFRVAQEDGRWWLIDPDGHPFWSTGLDCVAMNIDAAFTGIEPALSWLPEPGTLEATAIEPGHWDQQAIDYLKLNFMRAFGAQGHQGWAEITLALLHDWGFNTIANWSDWQIARQAGFPYVRPLAEHFPRTPLIYRSFPDVFHPDFEQDASDFALQLEETRDDPALIGYFLMNEPTWGFSSENLAEGMLYNTPSCASRVALANFLRSYYGSDEALARAWQMNVTLAQVADGPWTERLSAPARADLASFSARMAEIFFGTLSAACKQVDPHHLNLGARYYTVPPDWALRGMRSFDVFSINCYRQQVPASDLQRIHELLGLPTLIGEWHFGALDVGLPGSGIGHVRDQAARGQAYRFYVEQAAAIPWCVGVHYFTLYDQSALGRFDGENYNIGFLDVCNRPYQPLVDAARQAHERLYPVAAGLLPPDDQPPEYLPMLFL